MDEHQLLEKIVALGLLTPQQRDSARQMQLLCERQGKKIQMIQIAVSKQWISLAVLQCAEHIAALADEDFEFAHKALGAVSLEEISYCSELLLQGESDGHYLPLAEWLLQEKILDHRQQEAIHRQCGCKADNVVVYHFSGDLTHVLHSYSFPKRHDLSWGIGRTEQARIRLHSRRLHRDLYAAISCEKDHFYLQPHLQVSLNFQPVPSKCKLEPGDYIGIGEGDEEILLFKDSGKSRVDFVSRPNVSVAATLKREKIEEYTRRYGEAFGKVGFAQARVEHHSQYHGQILGKISFQRGEYWRKVLAVIRLYALFTVSPFRPSATATESLEAVGQLLLCYVTRIDSCAITAVVGYWPRGKEPMALSLRARQPVLAAAREVVERALDQWEGVWARDDQRTILAVPLFDDEGLRSFLYLESKVENEAARRVLAVLLGQSPSMGNALLNAIVVQKMKDKAILEDELKQAEKVQSDLMRGKVAIPDLQVCCLYRQTLKIGGDYCDAFQIPQSGYCIVIGDAMGHGIKASLMVSSFRAYLRSLLSGKETPERALAAVNEFLYADFHGFPYMMALLLFWDPQRQSLSWYDAGFQCKPLLLRSGQSQAQFLVPKPKGIILGTRSAPKFVEQTISFTPGDTLLLYTDGVPEARNPHGKEWGESGIQQAFDAEGARPLQEMLQRIYAQLAQFAQVQSHRQFGGLEKLAFWSQEWDDITLLALRRQPGEAHAALFDKVEQG